MKNITAAISLSYKLLNTLESKSFNASLGKAWTNPSSSANIIAIQETAISDLAYSLNQNLMSVSSELATSYLDHLVDVKSIKLNKSKKRGLIKGLTLDEYQMMNEFICKFSAQYRPVCDMQRGQFECHEILRSLINFLVIKDSVENGTGHQGLDKLVQTLLASKPTDFFKNGHLVDLFVLDRAFFVKKEDSSSLDIKCNKLYLSTYMQGKSGNADNDKYYDFYKVA